LFYESHFQRYVNNSKWKVCEHFQQGGHWRHLIVRSNHLNELMLIVIIHPQQLGEEEIREEMNNMAQYMLSSCKDLNLKSIYYQTWYVPIIVLTLFQNHYFISTKCLISVFFLKAHTRDALQNTHHLYFFTENRTSMKKLAI